MARGQRGPRALAWPAQPRWRELNLRPARLGVDAPRRLPRPYPRAGSRPCLGSSRRPTRAEGTSGGAGGSGSPAWIGSRISSWVLVEEEEVVVVIGVLFVLGMVLVPFDGRQPTATPRARRTARDASAPGRRRTRARPQDERRRRRRGGAARVRGHPRLVESRRLAASDEHDHAVGRSPADIDASRDPVDDPARSRCTPNRETTPNSAVPTILVKCPRQRVVDSVAHHWPRRRGQSHRSRGCRGCQAPITAPRGRSRGLTRPGTRSRSRRPSWARNRIRSRVPSSGSRRRVARTARPGTRTRTHRRCRPRRRWRPGST